MEVSTPGLILLIGLGVLICYLLLFGRSPGDAMDSIPLSIFFITLFAMEVYFILLYVPLQPILWTLGIIISFILLQFVINCLQ